MTRRWMFISMCALAAITATGASPPATSSYVSDQLIVEFYGPPDAGGLEAIELRYALSADHQLYGQPASFVFLILDGMDAADKRWLVIRDSSVCRVTLNYLGTIHATTPDRDPIGRCEGDDASPLWTPGSEGLYTEQPGVAIASSSATPSGAAPAQAGNDTAASPPLAGVSQPRDAQGIGAPVVLAAATAFGAIAAVLLIALRRRRWQVD